MIAANAGNNAGGIATFSQSGASYQYSLLWALAISGFCLAIVQEMCARMGVVTGKGLADLIREQFGVRWTAVAMLALLIANTRPPNYPGADCAARFECGYAAHPAGFYYLAGQ